MRHKNLKQTRGQICSLSTLVKVFLPFSFSAFSPKKEMEKENGTWWWGRETFWWTLGEHVERIAENENERMTEERGRENWSFWNWSMALPLGFSYIHTVKRFMGKKRGPVRQWRRVGRITWVVGESLPGKACGKTGHCEVEVIQSFTDLSGSCI